MQEQQETEYLLSLYESLILENYNSKDDKKNEVEINTSYEKKIKWLREERDRQKRKVKKLNDKNNYLEDTIKLKTSLINNYKNEVIAYKKAEFQDKLYDLSTFSRFFHKLSTLFDKFAMCLVKKSKKFTVIKKKISLISEEYREKHSDIETENITDHILMHGYKESRLDVLDESKSLIELKSILKEIDGNDNYNGKA